MLVRIVLITLAVLVVATAGLYGWSRLSPTKLEHSIEIEATPDEVWAVLTDFPSYPTWNPFMVTVEGTPTVGSTLSNTLMSNGSTMHFSPTVLIADPGRELRWIGRFGLPGIVDGEHWFRIEQLTPGRVRLTQGETFTGFLVPIAGSSLDVGTGFAAMNAAVKLRAESLS